MTPNDAGTMTRDEAVKVLEARVLPFVPFATPEWDAMQEAIAALQARSSAETWRDLAEANSALVDEIRDVVGLTGKPGDVVEAVRKLAALRNAENLRDAANEIVRTGRVSRRAGQAEYLVMILTDAADCIEALAQQPEAQAVPIPDERSGSATTPPERASYYQPDRAGSATTPGKQPEAQAGEQPSSSREDAPMADVELRPCPFCGGDAATREGSGLCFRRRGDD